MSQCRAWGHTCPLDQIITIKIGCSKYEQKAENYNNSRTHWCKYWDIQVSLTLAVVAYLYGYDIHI